MTERFFYCFFKYIHSLRLGESLNVGLLIVFPQSRKIVFRYPEDLQRLKCAYNDFHDDHLKAYLKSFRAKADEISLTISAIKKDDFCSQDFLNIIRNEFIKEDEGAIQISGIRTGLKYTENIEEIIEDIFYSYFEHFFDPEILVARKNSDSISKRDETYILATLKSLIDIQKPILKSFEFHGRDLITNNASLRFDLEWLNHGVHLVKPLSLDFRTASTIEEKAHSLHSKLHILGNETESDNVIFDVMVSKPQLSRLNSAYDKAVSILKKSSDRTNVIEEKDYKEYSKKVADALVS